MKNNMSLRLLLADKDKEIEKLRDEIKYYKEDRDKVEERLREEKSKKGYCKFKEECGKYAGCLREEYLKEIEKLKVIVQVVLQKKNLEELDIDKLYEIALKLKEEQMIEWK